MGPEFRQNCHITLTQGNLLEENHYYPFGLPITALSNKFVSSVENRHKYQGNEYLEANELRWMDFQARQYDAQLGRFLGIDPLAYSGGQQVYSPYAAMGNAPGEMIDPNGEMSKYADGLDYGLPHGGHMQSPSAASAAMKAYFSGDGSRGGVYGSFGAFYMFLFCGGGGTSINLDIANDKTKTPQINAEPNAYGLFVSFWYISSVDGPELSLEYLKFIGANIDDYVESVRGELPLIASGGQQQYWVYNDEKWLVADILGTVSNGTMVIDGAFNFVEHSKTGRFLANGYQHISKAEMAQTLKLAKPLTRGIAGVNLISQTISVADDFNHGRWKSGTTRGVVNGIILGVAAVNPLLGFGLGVAEALWGEYLYEYAEKTGNNDL